MSLKDIIKKLLKYEEPVRTIGLRTPKGEYLGDDVWLKRADREGYEYHDGERVLLIGIYRHEDWGLDNMVIFSEQFDHWQPPYDNEPISEEKRKEILSKLSLSTQGPFIDRVNFPVPKTPSTPKGETMWTNGEKVIHYKKGRDY